MALQPLGEGPPPLTQVASRPAPSRQVDWDDALDVSCFYGREEELATLEQWIVQEHCRVVSVLGLGGIGKSALSVTLMHQVAEHFEVVLFRSLRDAPSCEALLADSLQVLSLQPLSKVPASLQQRLRLFLECLHERRALLVLDNLEALLQEEESGGHSRSGGQATPTHQEALSHPFDGRRSNPFSADCRLYPCRR